MNSLPPTTSTRPSGRAAKPCCLAVSSDFRFTTAEGVSRRWRALCLDGKFELLAGDLHTSVDDPLVVVREKALELARRHGFEPQRFILENT